MMHLRDSIDEVIADWSSRKPMIHRVGGCTYAYLQGLPTRPRSWLDSIIDSPEIENFNFCWRCVQKNVDDDLVIDLSDWRPDGEPRA